MSAEASAALAASLGYKDGILYEELSAKAEVGGICCAWRSCIMLECV